MISVIIPLMPIPPYNTRVWQCVQSLNRQTKRPQIIVEKQEIEDYINKNRLLNAGYRKAEHDYIWHCDADFLLPDKTLLERMKDKIDSGIDVIWPMYKSGLKHYNMKVADGGPFMKRQVLDEYGPLDETLLGVSRVTFPFMLWCLKNKRAFGSPEYCIAINNTKLKRTYRPARRHKETLEKTKLAFGNTKKILEGRGLWEIV